MARADLAAYADLLSIWFSCLDSAPAPLADVVRRFEEGVTWEEVVEHTLNGEGLAGRSPLSTPTASDARIGGRLAILRKVADEKVAPLDFAFRYADHRDTSVEAMADNVSERIFLPLSEELRRILADTAEDALGEVTPPVVIVIDHASVPCAAVREAVERAIALIQGDNVLEAPTKARLTAELGVALQLIDQPETNVETTEGVLEGAHRWLKADGKNVLLTEATKEAVSQFVGLCKMALGVL